MEVVELQIFQFKELDEQAKEKARDWYRQDMNTLGLAKPRILSRPSAITLG